MNRENKQNNIEKNKHRGLNKTKVIKISLSLFVVIIFAILFAVSLQVIKTTKIGAKVLDNLSGDTTEDVWQITSVSDEEETEENCNVNYDDEIALSASAYNLSGISIYIRLWESETASVTLLTSTYEGALGETYLDEWISDWTEDLVAPYEFSVVLSVRRGNRKLLRWYIGRLYCGKHLRLQVSGLCFRCRGDTDGHW